MEGKKKTRLAGIVDVTPNSHAACPPFGSCPRIYAAQDRYYIIGQLTDPDELGEDVAAHIGPGEQLIEIPATLIDDLEPKP